MEWWIWEKSSRLKVQGKNTTACSIMIYGSNYFGLTA